MAEADIALVRDVEERAILAELAAAAERPVVTFTDGPIELFTGRGLEGEQAADLRVKQQTYQEKLYQLRDLKAITAGYVDKPSANLVIRLLELFKLSNDELKNIRTTFPLRGVTDRSIYLELLDPGERSAIFRIQSRTAALYPDELAPHFFYLNVGRPGKPALARVEVPAWVAKDRLMLQILHAALVDQCRIVGARPYPYLLHRAHEAAVVTLPEKEQVTQMIVLELRQRGIQVEDTSNKQFAKGLAGRTRYGP